MSIILMSIFVAIPLVLGSIVLGATFHHWFKNGFKEKKANPVNDIHHKSV